MGIGDWVGISLFTVCILMMGAYVWAGAREQGRYAAKHYGIKNKWGRRSDFTPGEDRRFKIPVMVQIRHNFDTNDGYYCEYPDAHP